MRLATSKIGYKTVHIEEGQAKILVPEITAKEDEPLQRARFKVPVFYNPDMKLNRDSSILALGAMQGILSRDLRVCEPMCGTGIRGIRIALEVNGIEKIVLGDLNPFAVRLAEENVQKNLVSEKIVVRSMEANLLLSLNSRPSSRFDYIDIDPYGTPTPYIDSTVRASNRDGIVALTATDMAPLCGVNPKACIRKYGGRSLKTPYSRELAIRILAGTFVRRAAVHEISSKPVCSFVIDHYVRLYMIMSKGKRKANDNLKKIGYLLHCQRCKNRLSIPVVYPFNEVCEDCGAQLKIAGPLWVGELANYSFCEKMLKLSESSFIGSNRRLIDTIEKVKGEIGFPPGFYSLDKVSSSLKISSLPIEPVLKALREVGFQASRSHADDRGIKTDAPFDELKRMILGTQKRL